jgi:Arc/MetJ-type ribon-helix-helix transcriptional regulator
MPKEMERTTVLLTPEHMKGLDKLVTDGVYPNRSEAVRSAVRDLLAKGG